ncbi:MAG: PAS domain S-box protein, partial [Candidatus Cloacimonadota bacterium]
MNSESIGEGKIKKENSGRMDYDNDLVELEDYINDIWRFLPVPVAYVSPLGVILDTDCRLEELLQCVKDEMVGNLLSGFFPEKNDFAQIQKHTLENGLVQNTECMMRTRKGVEIPVIISTLLRKDENGETVGYFISMHDISVEKAVSLTLVESEQKFRTLAEQSPNMIFINCKSRVVYANKRCEELMGYTRNEFLSSDFDFLSLIAPESVDLIESAFAKHMKGDEVTPFEYTLIAKDGSRIDAILAPKLIEFEGEKAILGVITDTTEYKRTLQALSESESKYKILVEMSPEAITVADLEGYITDVSKCAIELCGAKSADDIIGKKSLELIVPEDRERAVRNMGKTLEDGFLRDVEYTFFRMDGTRYIGELNAAVIRDVHGKPKAFIATIRDITQRKRSENALRESEAKYRTLVEQSLQGILIVQGFPIRLVFVNPMLADIFGYSSSELIALSDNGLFELIHPEDRMIMRERVKLVMAGKPSGRREIRIIRKDGSVRWLEIMGNAIDWLGKPAVQITVIDTSERKKMQEELQRSERIKLLAQLAMGVSHEVRNPLGAILASTEALYHDLEEHSEYSEYLSHIRIQVNRLSVLMKDLLELGRPIGEITFENESLQMLCSSAVELWKQSTTFKHHTLKFVKPDGLEHIVIRADGARLQQVCLNLLENAAQNSPEGSEIMLKIFKPEGDSVRIHVI